MDSWELIPKGQRGKNNCQIWMDGDRCAAFKKLQNLRNKVWTLSWV